MLQPPAHGCFVAPLPNAYSRLLHDCTILVKWYNIRVSLSVQAIFTEYDLGVVRSRSAYRWIWLPLGLN